MKIKKNMPFPAQLLFVSNWWSRRVYWGMDVSLHADRAYTERHGVVRIDMDIWCVKSSGRRGRIPVFKSHVRARPLSLFPKFFSSLASNPRSLTEDHIHPEALLLTLFWCARRKCNLSTILKFQICRPGREVGCENRWRVRRRISH